MKSIRLGFLTFLVFTKLTQAIGLIETLFSCCYTSNNVELAEDRTNTSDDLKINRDFSDNPFNSNPKEILKVDNATQTEERHWMCTSYSDSRSSDSISNSFFSKILNLDKNKSSTLFPDN